MGRGELTAMNYYMDNIIIPYVNKVKDDCGLPLGQRASGIFDCFRGQITDEFTVKLFLHHRATESHRSFTAYGTERKQMCQIVFEKRV